MRRNISDASWSAFWAPNVGFSDFNVLNGVSPFFKPLKQLADCSLVRVRYRRLFLVGVDVLRAFEPQKKHKPFKIREKGCLRGLKSCLSVSRAF